MRLFITLLLSAALLPAAAVERKPLAVAAITTQQAAIRADVEAGAGRYRDMPLSTRGELLRQQDTLLRLLEGKVSTAELAENDRLLAFNTLEWIEATINNAEAERMVCKHEKTIGSNRMQRVCKTVAQMEADREAVRQNLNSGCVAGICGHP